jgi:phage tail-like protein
VAGFSKVSALTRTTQVLKHRSGEDPLAPGQSKYGAVTFERGVTHDAAFEQWANKVWDYHNATADDQQDGVSNPNVSLQDFRKDIVLELYNESGQKVLAYNIYRCWPSEFVSMPELDATSNAVAIQSLKLENEGWERDTAGEDVTDPSFTLPL